MFALEFFDGMDKKAANRRSVKRAQVPTLSEATVESAEQDARRKDKTTPLAVVAIGASAGGLEAYTGLLRLLPSDTGLAFVLVQHLAPKHESGLRQILSGVTSMPVHEVTNGLRVKADHVYVIPPNASMFIRHGVLSLQLRSESRLPRRPIDQFFESLAQDQQERAIGVILSGTGNDGTFGLESIKAEGGITFAQDASAAQDSMPRSAIEAGCVDYVFSPEQIAAELTRIANHPFISHCAPEIITSEAARDEAEQPSTKAKRGQAGRSEDGLRRILVLLRNHCGVDFSLYKASTMQRRITRRMLLSQKDTISEYADFLNNHRKELDTLYNDLLIGVTSFFRNEEAFASLKHEVFPKLLKQLKKGESLRVWVIGCSTGEEAYSIAMSFAEFAEHIQVVPKLQIFATDLNEMLLNKGRQGLYAKTLAKDVSHERLRRFFIEEEAGYRVSKSLREKVVFARHNLINDPPFSRLDLISCRNVLIYLEPELQKKIIPAFHYALKPYGFLFLGASESIGQFTDLFAPCDKKHKIFSKQLAPRQLLQLPGRGGQANRLPSKHLPSAIGREEDDDLRLELNAQREADRISLSQFAPSGVLINADLQVVQFRGSTDAYLEPPTGKATFDILKMARKGLMLPLRSAIDKAKKERQTVRTENVHVHQTGGGTQAVIIHVIPMKNIRERCFLVLFEPAAAKPARRERTGPTRKPLSKKEESRRIAGLESELAETRDYVQSMQDQFDATSEKLQVSNEEVQSANEELQSINEELETSKEELESSNEELTTVNEELVNRNAEVSQLNSDLTNLQINIQTAVLLVGRDLSIRRFTSPAAKIFNLLATDIGRSFSDIKHNLGHLQSELPRADAGSAREKRHGGAARVQESCQLGPLVKEVIDTIAVRSCELQDKEGRWYSLTVRPYMTLDNKVDGAVLVLVDIDLLKRSEQEAKLGREYNEAVIRTMRDPFVVLDGDLCVHTANEAFYKTFKVRIDETEGRFIYEIGNGQWNIPRLRSLLEDVLPKNSFFNDMEVVHDFPTIGRRTMLLNGRKVDRSDRGKPLILLCIEDVTERLESRARMKASEIHYRRLFEAAGDGILLLDPVSRKITDANPFMTKLLGYTRQELTGKELWQIGLIKDEQASHAAFSELQQRGFITYNHLPLQDKNGGQHDVEFVSSLYDVEGTKVIQCLIRDITASRQELALFRSLFDLMPQLGWTALPDGFIDWYNKGWYEYTGTNRESLRGWGWESALDPELLPAVVQGWKRSIATGEPFEMEFPLRRHDGEFRWFLTRATLIKDVEGKPFRWVGINTDIQDQRDEAKRLEELVAQRTGDLRIARDEAIVASEAKSRFLATISHEVRTPLFSVIGIVELLAATATTDELSMMTTAALEQSRRLLQILNNLLDASKLQTGKITLEHRNFHLRPVLGDVVQLVKPEASKKGLPIRSHVDPEVPEEVCGDELRVRQILLNLLFNAVKFTSKGHVAISCSVLERLADRLIIQFVIEDTGTGIAESQKEHLFEPFVQAADSTTQVFGGTGLGLSICRNLLAMMGGDVGVDSQLGKGSTFRVRIPFAYVN